MGDEDKFNLTAVLQKCKVGGGTLISPINPQGIFQSNFVTTLNFTEDLLKQNSSRIFKKNFAA